MVTLRTPGAYGAEAGAGPCAIEPADGSVAAFVGYTERAGEPGRSLHLKPQRIESLQGFERHFGAAAGQRSRSQNCAIGRCTGASTWGCGSSSRTAADLAGWCRSGATTRHRRPRHCGPAWPPWRVNPSRPCWWCRTPCCCPRTRCGPCTTPCWRCARSRSGRASRCSTCPAAIAGRAALTIRWRPSARGWACTDAASARPTYPDLDTSVLDEAEVDWRQVDADALGALAARVRADAACPPAVRAQLVGPDIDWADSAPDAAGAVAGLPVADAGRCAAR
jgi:hypothetical protein